MIVRNKGPGDKKAIRRLNTIVFGQPQEAYLVDALRDHCDDLLSLVAVDGDDIVGHILFSPAIIADVAGMGLGPIAVAPEQQGGGIGSELIRAGLAKLEKHGCPFVIVFGHPEYYPRFGFERANRYGVRCEWDVPDDVFMVLVLDEAAMKGCQDSRAIDRSSQSFRDEVQQLSDLHLS